MPRKHLKIAEWVTKEDLLNRNFFYHRVSGEYFLVLNPDTCLVRNVEASLIADLKKRTLRLYVTNDHKRLPSIRDKKYNKDNYKEFEDVIDAYSFADVIDLSPIYKLIIDKLITIV
jgi:hypothetical protein